MVLFPLALGAYLALTPSWTRAYVPLSAMPAPDSAPECVTRGFGELFVAADLPGARKMFARALSLDPHAAEAEFFLGALAWKFSPKPDYAVVLDRLQKAYRDSGDPFLEALTAQCLAESGHGDKATALYVKAHADLARGWERKLTKADLAWGEEQLRRILADRPWMKAYVRPRDRLWRWTVRKLAGESCYHRIQWDPDPPRGAAAVTSDAGDPAGDLVLRILNPGPTSWAGAWCWESLIFELLNNAQRSRFHWIALRAMAEGDTLTSLAAEYALVEEDTSRKVQSFYADVWLPRCRKYGKDPWPDAWGFYNLFYDETYRNRASLDFYMDRFHERDQEGIIKVNAAPGSRLETNLDSELLLESQEYAFYLIQAGRFERARSILRNALEGIPSRKLFTLSRPLASLYWWLELKRIKPGLFFGWRIRSAKRMLARVYDDPDFVKSLPTDTRGYIRHAQAWLNQGSGAASTSLALEDTSVRQPQIAVLWLELASDEGSSEARRQLLELLKEGNGAVPDPGRIQALEASFPPIPRKDGSFVLYQGAPPRGGYAYAYPLGASKVVVSQPGRQGGHCVEFDLATDVWSGGALGMDTVDLSKIRARGGILECWVKGKQGGETGTIGFRDRGSGTMVRLNLRTYLPGGGMAKGRWTKVSIPLQAWPDTGDLWHVDLQKNTDHRFDWSKVGEVIFDCGHLGGKSYSFAIDDVRVVPKSASVGE